MPVSDLAEGPAVGPFQVFDGFYPARRFFRWSGAPPSPDNSVAGGDVDGASGPENLPGGGPGHSTCAYVACPGWPFKVEAGEAFSAGIALASDTQGCAKRAVAGEVIVAISLEASAGPGSLVWAYFTSGR